jgi:DNA-binding FadR family transcriptional regulator
MESPQSIASPPSALRGLQKNVIDAIGRDIVAQNFLAESFLPTEPELCLRFSVSRTSVREAMRVLSAKGLIEIRQKIGTKVQDVKHWNLFDVDILRWHEEVGASAGIMRDLIELRQILEPAAAKFAASRATIENHVRLKNAIEAMRKAVNSPKEYVEADLLFHLEIYYSSQNALMGQFGNVVADFLRRAFLVQQKVVRDSSFLVRDVELHNLVFEAIDSGDTEEAAKAMERVVLEGKNSLFQALDSRRYKNSGGQPNK